MRRTRKEIEQDLKEVEFHIQNLRDEMRVVYADLDAVWDELQNPAVRELGDVWNELHEVKRVRREKETALYGSLLRKIYVKGELYELVHDMYEFDPYDNDQMDTGHN